MTWGSNPTDAWIECPYCRGLQKDNANPPIHQRTCYARSAWRKLADRFRKRDQDGAEWNR